MGLEKVELDVNDGGRVRDFAKLDVEHDRPVFTRRSEVDKFAPAAVIKPTIFGLDENGEMDHNFPCPVCTNTPATYTELDGKHVFSPCNHCAEEGYALIKKKSFWSWR